MPYFDLAEVFLVYSFCRFLFIVSKRANESLLIKLIYLFFGTYSKDDASIFRC